MADLLSVTDETLASRRHLLQDLFKVLRGSKYWMLQYIPTRRSAFAIFKEWENLINLFTRRKHLTFYYSIFPGFYLWWISRKDRRLRFLYSFCFLNEPA